MRFKKTGNVFPNLLTLEGIDGSGKSTQAASVRDALKDMGFRVEIVKVKCFAAQAIYELAKQHTGDPYAYHPLIPAELREFVLACDILQFSHTVISPLIEEEAVVIWDRGPLSYRCYAEVYNGFTPWVKAIHDLFPIPKCAFFLDVSADRAAKRLKIRSEKPMQSDETERLLFDVRQMMQKHARASTNVKTLEGNQPMEMLTESIVDQWMKGCGKPRKG